MTESDGRCGCGQKRQGDTRGDGWGGLFCVLGAALYFLLRRLDMGLAFAIFAYAALAGACAVIAREAYGERLKRWLKRPDNDDKDRLISLLLCAVCFIVINFWSTSSGTSC